MNLTYEEQQVIAIFDNGTREGTIAAIEDVRSYIEPDETELRSLVESTLEKLRAMTDAEFESLELVKEY